MDSATPADPGLDPPSLARTNISLDINDVSRAMRQTSVANSSPMASAPPTPSFQSRHPSQPYASPTTHSNTNSPKPAVIRRPSSSASLSRAPSSPRLMKKSSRASLGGGGGNGGTPEEQDNRPTPKRSISNLISGLREAQCTMEAIEEPIPLTAADIATAHFSRELKSHGTPLAEAETIVILHDACYGHRWSRLKTPKSHLSLIVERPERIHASVLGASTAYVRLGGHHAGARSAPHPERSQVSNPPFEIRRSGRVMEITSPYVTTVHGTSWMSELQGMCHSAGEKLAAGAKELELATTPGEPEKHQLHEGDLYLAPGSLDAFQGALGGVADAVDTIFAPTSKTKRAFVAVRPPGHHCSADHPSGFCWLNNVHVGIEYAAQMYGLTHAAILDIDLHHGDGSQAIAWARNSQNYEKRQNAKPNSKLKLNPDIGYYSMHDINSYPCEWGDDEKVQAASLCIENAHNQSIWNVHLQPWKTEEEFWKLYEERYRIILDKAKLFLQHHSDRVRLEGKVRPKTAIFISAGFDASEWEGAGMQRHKVSVPTDFYARFTQDVVKLAQEVDGCEGRVISVLEGGYSDRALCSGVLSHLSGLCASPITPQTNGVEGLMDLSDHMNGLSINGLGSKDKLQYTSDWWSASNLTALENKINPPPPPQAKKGRGGSQPTYATPTESFAYKVVDPNKFARSISGTMREPAMYARPPTPPPPEVDWVVATQELSKLLIPTDRQTRSCTAEELAGPKKERQTHAPTFPPEGAAQTRQLRDRKAKAPAYAESTYSDETASVRSVSRAESRTSRRETIDVLPTGEPTPGNQRRASRRLSAGSTLSTISHAAVDADAPPVPSIPSVATKPTPSTMKPPPIPASSTQLANKKVRAPSKVRQGAAATSAPASPVEKNAPLSGQSVVNPQGGSIEVDNLTSGMKKITLKVSTTKEEHDRKQKERLDAQRRERALKGAETRRVNAAKKASGGNIAPTTSSTTNRAAASGAAIKQTRAEPVDPAAQKKLSELHEAAAPTKDAIAPASRPSSHVPAKENIEPSHISGNGWRDPRVSPTQIDPRAVDPPVSTTSGDIAESNPHRADPIDVPATMGVPAAHMEFSDHANGTALTTPPVLAPTETPAPPPLEPELTLTHESNDSSSASKEEPPATESAAHQPPQTALWTKTGPDSTPQQFVPNGSTAAMDNTTWAPRPVKASQLPVFKSTGPIPFAASGVTAHSPQRLWKSGERLVDEQPPGSQLHGLLERDPHVITEDTTMWDVPDTPGK